VKDVRAPRPELIDALGRCAFALAPLFNFSRQAVRTAGLRHTAGRSDRVANQLANASRERIERASRPPSPNRLVDEFSRTLRCRPSEHRDGM
jgi:hypothetical protein